MKTIFLLIFFSCSLLLSAQTCYNPGDGSDGIFAATSNTSIAGGTYNFTSFTIDAGVTVYVTGSSPLFIYCTGQVNINGILTAKGGDGSAGVTYTSGGIGGIGVAGGGNGGDGTYSASSGPITAFAGIGPIPTNNQGDGWSGGGGGGYATTGFSTGSSSGGFGGPAYGNIYVSGLEPGSGGGGGSGGLNCGAGGGGAGGGVIVINAVSIDIGATGFISVNGGNGGSDGGGNCGGGGAGSGGTVWLAALTINNNGSVTALAGIGGASNIAGNPYYGTGGNGSEGRIRVDMNGGSGTGIYNPVPGSSFAIPTNPLSVSNGTIVSACDGNNNGEANLNVSGGIGLYSYSWLPGSSETTNPAIQLPGGMNSYTVTDAAFCFVSGTVDIPAANSTTYSQAIEICHGDTFSIGSSHYTSTGIYNDILTSFNGCDSTVTTDLTVLDSIYSVQSLTICYGDTIHIGSNSYYTTGIYSDILSSYTGCDSTVTTDLTVEAQISTTVTLLGDSLTAAENGAIYQWLDCDNSNTPVAGEINQSFSPAVSGNYSVEITVNSCTNTSSCIYVNLVGAIAYKAEESIQIYPNPARTYVNIEVSNELKDIEYFIFNQTGEMMLNGILKSTSSRIDLSSLAEGIYLIKTGDVFLRKLIIINN
jgi:hypothetical protein